MSKDSGSLCRVQERFARQAAHYVTSESHARGSDLELLLEMTEPRRDWIVLDVATGGGHTALKVAHHVARVIACDLSHTMLRAAQTHAEDTHCDRIDFVCAQAERLPHPSSRFDLVTCRIAAHHFVDAQRFLGMSWRVLKDGGRLVLQDHVLPDDPKTAEYVERFERLRDPTHNRAFTAAEWYLALVAAGFRVEHSHILTKRHGFLNWAKRQNCTARTIEQLVEMINGAPSGAADWLQPLAFDQPEASFVNHHIVIAATKHELPSAA